MSTNPNFDPQHSTNHIWRDEDADRCLTDDLDAMDEAIAGKAAAAHNHDGYAASEHTHTGFAASIHSHEMAQILGLVAAMLGKADLVDGKVPESQLPSYVDDVIEANTMSGFPTTGEDGKVYLAKDTNKSYRWGGTTYVELTSGAALGETSATAYRGDRGKIAYEHSQDSNIHVTAAQKSAWDGKAAGDHVHAISAIPGLLDMLLTDTAGREKYTIAGDVLTTIAGYAAGVHTAYSAGGSNATATNAPNTIESWRYLIHKNYANYGWVMAFGSEGSFFLNYLDGGNWRGWKPIWDNNPAPLWTGAYYMNANQTIYPSKKLSECRTGWVLQWSDYSNGAATDGDVVETFIYKRCYSGGNWSGHSRLCEIPTDVTASGESRCIKKVYIWNDRIIGHAINDSSPRNNVVLRGVYEF